MDKRPSIIFHALQQTPLLMYTEDVMYYLIYQYTNDDANLLMNFYNVTNKHGWSWSSDSCSSQNSKRSIPEP